MTTPLSDQETRENRSLTQNPIIIGEEDSDSFQDQPSSNDSVAEEDVGTTDDQVTPATVVTTRRLYEQKPVTNPLHDYASYTYNLSLHLLGIDTYNQLVGELSPDKVYVPKNVLVVSAGRYNQFFNRDPAFTEDFYFDNFRMKTYVAPTQRNRNSNLIECSFTIVEPNGFTFINRLIDAVRRQGQSDISYIQMPYLLQIDFFGEKTVEGNNFNNPVTNNGPIPGMSKYIPIRLTEIKTKVSVRGTEYQISAVPYNHQAFNQQNVTLPISTTVTGSFVKDIFSGGASTNFTSLINVLEQREEQIQQIGLLQRQLSTPVPGFPNLFTSDSTEESIRKEISRRQELVNKFTNIGINGYCSAIIQYYQTLKRRGAIGIINTVRVEFAPEIGDSRLIEAPVTPTSVPASGNTNTDQKSSIQGQGNNPAERRGKINYDGTTLNIPANMSIERLIDWTVRNSKYISDQITDPEDREKIQNNKESVLPTWLNWFKITSNIKIKEFDPTQNKFAYDIIYYVTPFKVANKHPFAAKGRVPGYVKEYNYIFTGKNNDILDLSIDFNLLAVVEISIGRNKERYVQPAVSYNNPSANPRTPTSDVTLDNELSEAAAQQQQLAKQSKTNPNAVVLQYVSGSSATTNRGRGGNLRDSTSAGDIQRSLMVPAKGDMISIDLKILGDPQFIKQDDIFYYQALNPINSQFINNTPGSSLYMDGNELYVFLNIQSPIDYDESKGIAVKGKYEYSAFNGVYKVITIENIFQKGKFEQVLNLAKLFYDQEGEPLPAINQRQENIQESNLVPIARISGTRYAGPAVNLAAALIPVQNVQAAINSVAAVTGGGTSNSSNPIKQLGQRLINQEVNKLVNQGIKTITDTIFGDAGGIAGSTALSRLSEFADIEFLDGVTAITPTLSGLDFEDFLPPLDWAGDVGEAVVEGATAGLDLGLDLLEDFPIADIGELFDIGGLFDFG